jgi:hypothetical protein
MKKHKIVTCHDRDTGSLLGFWILFVENKKYTGLAQNGKPLQFATRKEAKDYLKQLKEAEKTTS